MKKLILTGFAATLFLSSCNKDEKIQTVSLEQQKLDYQTRQLDLEKQKLAIEKEKINFEKQKDSLNKAAEEKEKARVAANNRAATKSSPSNVVPYRIFFVPSTPKLQIG